MEALYGSAGRAADISRSSRAGPDITPWAQAQVDATRALRLDPAFGRTGKALLEGIPADQPCSSTAHKAGFSPTRAHLLVVTIVYGTWRD